MKKTLLLITALSLTGCTSMIDTMDGFAGLGKLSVKTNQFDQSKVISLTPDKLYNPAGGLSSVDTELGALWSSQMPNFVTIILKDSGSSSYTNFSSLSINISGEITDYKVGNTQFDDSGYNQVVNSIFTSSTAKAVIPMSTFKEMLAAKGCLLKIGRSEGYEVASCSTDRIPGGKKTAILGLKKMLNEIENQTPN